MLWNIAVQTGNCNISDGFKINKGPSLITARSGHCSAMMKIGGKTILVVVGGCHARHAGWFSRDMLGMISYKKSLITIFGQKHKIKNFIRNFYIFHEKNFNAFEFWFIFGIKLLILKQNYIKMIDEF